jgi:hypothetical protein
MGQMWRPWPYVCFCSHPCFKPLSIFLYITCLVIVVDNISEACFRVLEVDEFWAIYVVWFDVKAWHNVQLYYILVQMLCSLIWCWHYFLLFNRGSSPLRERGTGQELCYNHCCKFLKIHLWSAILLFLWH